MQPHDGQGDDGLAGPRRLACRRRRWRRHRSTTGWPRCAGSASTPIGGGSDPAAELRSAAATGEAELTRLRGTPDPQCWAAAVAAWERTGFPVPAAYCGWRQAEAVLASGGDRDNAAALFAAASSAAVELGAQPLAGRHRAVGAAGADRRRRECPGRAAGRSTDGDFGITAREFEVLELLARGWTNKQIAESLFISEKTARVHVSHLLTKLAVPTRGAAVDVAHRHGLLLAAYSARGAGAKLQSNPK